LKNFEEIYEEHNVAMVRVASKLVSDSEVVSDIVQEVFVYLHGRLDAREKIIYPRSWLYRATFNKCVDHLRTHSRFVDVAELKDVPTNENAIANEDVKSAIQQALSSLPTKERILVIAYSEGMSYRELAELTGITYTSIGKTLSRALKKLAKEMKKEEYGLY
jgi:RNA polymerase sigma-70 factor (ECF subfamily)